MMSRSTFFLAAAIAASSLSAAAQAPRTTLLKVNGSSVRTDKPLANAAIHGAPFVVWQSEMFLRSGETSDIMVAAKQDQSAPRFARIVQKWTNATNNATTTSISFDVEQPVALNRMTQGQNIRLFRFTADSSVQVGLYSFNVQMRDERSNVIQNAEVVIYVGSTTFGGELTPVRVDGVNFDFTTGTLTALGEFPTDGDMFVFAGIPLDNGVVLTTDVTNNGPANTLCVSMGADRVNPKWYVGTGDLILMYQRPSQDGIPSTLTVNAARSFKF
jgi:lipopolysaccharide export system protein LptA